ncbi:asparagine synthase-related protein [Verrucomicrobiota bacterium]
MIYPIINLKKVEKLFTYYEYPLDPEKGIFIEIEKNDVEVRVKVDRFAAIPFYYAVFENTFYGATKLDLLLHDMPEHFRRKLNIRAAIQFLRTNTMIAEETLMEEIRRIPYGSELVFNKKNGRLHLRRYWRLPGESRRYSEKDALHALHDSFDAAVKDSTQETERVGMHLSGGMDSRQIMGALLENNVEVKAFTYGVPENLDVVIAGRLVKSMGLEHYMIEHKGVFSFKDNFEKQIMLTDGMQALFHGHGLEVHEVEKQYVDTVVYGHFIDLFSQAHQYNPLFEHDQGQQTKESLYQLFNGGACSIMRVDEKEDGMFARDYVGLFKESICQEIDKLDYMDAEKKYDALYFIHHGFRRLLPQALSGAQFLDFRLPGLHRDFFEVQWGIPGRLKKHRRLQRKLISRFYPDVSEVHLVRNNTQLEYCGSNILKKVICLTQEYLRKEGLITPLYNYYGAEMRRLANGQLYQWMKSEIQDGPLRGSSFLKETYMRRLFSDDMFQQDVSVHHYGALMMLSAFMRNFLVSCPSI